MFCLLSDQLINFLVLIGNQLLELLETSSYFLLNALAHAFPNGLVVLLVHDSAHDDEFAVSLRLSEVAGKVISIKLVSTFLQGQSSVFDDSGVRVRDNGNQVVQEVDNEDDRLETEHHPNQTYIQPRQS